jgi:hypothetical protein
MNSCVGDPWPAPPTRRRTSSSGRRSSPPLLSAFTLHPPAARMASSTLGSMADTFPIASVAMAPGSICGPRPGASAGSRDRPRGRAGSEPRLPGAAGSARWPWPWRGTVPASPGSAGVWHLESGQMGGCRCAGGFRRARDVRGRPRRHASPPLTRARASARGSAGHPGPRWPPRWTRGRVRGPSGLSRQAAARRSPHPGWRRRSQG